MALAPVPPWESVNPLDFISAMSQGARIGLDRANLETQANEARQRLGLSYAQLAGENARAHAGAQLRALENANAFQQWREEQARRIQEHNDQQQLNLAHLGLQTTAAQQLNDRFNKTLALRREDLTRKEALDANKIDDLSKMSIVESEKRVNSARAKLSALQAGDADPKAIAEVQAELNSALAELQHRKGSAAAISHPADPLAPYGWVSTPGAPGIEPVLRPRRAGEPSASDMLVNPDMGNQPAASPTDTDPLGLRQ